ncbi:MAG: redoxin domain-containing protein [Candidatus Dormibacteraeota bacterium]|nr:redoxin domain-containing protein [Candidatus Dormibacteraeota bacterium]MBV9524327.1 redoxin domain-containing protein [Candidatus Dormibacteraeota bacterium]
MAIATGRVRAPELRGAGGWINTAEPLTLQQLRGRAVVLDFWTFCCINCLRVVEELRELEHRFGAALVVIGVHSPKFPHESDHAAVERAVRRHRIEHPVLDDPEMQTWQRYGVRAWPTLVLIDPEGYVAAVAPGEGNGPALGDLIERLLAGRDAPTAPAFLAATGPPDAALAYPGKVASDGSRRVAVADTGHDRVLVCDLDGAVQREFAGFHQPHGVRFDAGRLLVCDTVAGDLVEVDLDSGERRVLATGMRSPWDVVVCPDGSLLVAEAGLHRLLSVPARGGEFTVVAGTRAEGLRDGPALQAHLAQPSGLTVIPDGAIAFADSEVSALRMLRDGAVETLVGQGLFDWGAVDGDRETGRLQHPLGVAAVASGGIAVADTFNSALRIWRDGSLRTVALDDPLDEPGGIDILPDGRALVADTNHHRVVAVDLAAGAVTPIPVAERAASLAGSAGSSLRLEATVELDGEMLDVSQGPPVHVNVSVDPESLLGAGARSWALDSLPAAVDVTLGRPGQGTLTLDLIASTCHDDVCTIKRTTRRHSLRVS